MNKKNTHKSEPNRLQYALLANGTFSGISGFVLMMMSKLVTNLLGTLNHLPDWFFPVVGLNLAVFAGILYFIAMQKPISKFWVKIIIALDISWVLGSFIVIILFHSFLSSIAPVIIFGVALIVSIFAYLQWRHLNRKI